MESGAPTLSKSSLTELLNDHSIDAIIAIDTAYNVIAWNKTASLIYSVSKTQAIGKSVFQLIPSLKQDDETFNAIKIALSGSTAFVSASKLFTHRQHKENHFIPLKNNDGILIGAMNIVHDVAHRIKAEQQLQNLNEELERRLRQLKITSDELASFTYITSNKIKEPIRQVYTSVEHLIRTEAGRLSDSGKASFRRMQSSLNRMDLLLDDILSLTQISVLQKPNAEVDLNEVISEVSNHIIKKTEKQVSILAENLCSITGHKNYLYLLFYNLLDNAVKFNESSVPEIKITCEKVILNEGNIDAFPLEYSKVTITDNGIGFDAADADRIFTMLEKLHDKKYKGSGMGLTVSKKIMEAHEGFIRTESEPGKGSSFSCFFPSTTFNEI